MKIAFIGSGEVGLTYARALSEQGHSISLCDLRLSDAAKSPGQAIGAEMHAAMGSWMLQVDVVISCVVGTVSLPVARQAFGAMRVGALFADMTTCDPDDIRTAAREAGRSGIRYADIAIMGAVALGGIRTNLLVAGKGSDDVRALLEGTGAPVRAVEGGEAGDAAALKILRSVFTKGLEALAVECFMAAERQGVTDKLYDALSDVDRNPLRDTLEAFVRTHVLHAPRRLKEIEEAERQLSKAGLPVDVLPGVRSRFQRTCDYLADGPNPIQNPDAAQALAWLDERFANSKPPVGT